MEYPADGGAVGTTTQAGGCDRCRLVSLDHLDMGATTEGAWGDVHQSDSSGYRFCDTDFSPHFARVLPGVVKTLRNSTIGLLIAVWCATCVIRFV